MHRALKGVEFDVAVVKTAHDWRTLLRDVAVVLIIRRRRRPVVLQLHGSHPSTLVRQGSYAFKLATALLLRLVDAVLVLSTEEQRQWQEFRGRPPVFTVKNPYVRVFSSGTAAATAREHPRLLFVGRLMREKGVFDVIDALPRVVAKTQATAVIAGEGPAEPSCDAGSVSRARRARHLAGVPGGFSARGGLPRGDAVRVPASWDEGFPDRSRRSDGCRAADRHDADPGARGSPSRRENALFVEPWRLSALVDAILTLLDDRDLRRACPPRTDAASESSSRASSPKSISASSRAVART